MKIDSKEFQTLKWLQCNVTEEFKGEKKNSVSTSLFKMIKIESD